MNENHLQLVFSNYIEQFQQINNTEHKEYFKWEIANCFRTKMDEALSVPNEEFPGKLYEIKKLTSILIDSYTQPLGGLVEFARRQPDTVRSLFQNLFADDAGSLTIRQEKVSDFLTGSHALRDQYFPGSYLYSDDMHSVTGYLFLYDPDHSYLFKALHARKFADCVEFNEDWGSGDSVSLPVYYRMCDELVEHIRESEELLAVDESRFANDWGVDPDKLYPDPEKHVLAFDLIYCGYTYDLYQGITFAKTKGKDRQQTQERIEMAKKLADRCREAETLLTSYGEAVSYVNSVFCAGATLWHKIYGYGTVKENSGKRVVVEFPEAGEKMLGTVKSAAKGIIRSEDAEFDDRMEKYSSVLSREENALRSSLALAQKQLAPYVDLLE